MLKLSKIGEKLLKILRICSNFRLFKNFAQKRGDYSSFFKLINTFSDYISATEIAVTPTFLAESITLTIAPFVVSSLV